MAEAPVFVVTVTGEGVRVSGRLVVHLLQLPAPSVITSIEALAASYLTVIQRTQPFGPYRLLGRGLGGLVAYELATQLLGRDEGVEFLGMTECPRPRNASPGASGEAAMALGERYCPQPLPIPVFYFVSDERSERAEIDATRAWRALAGDSLRVITSRDALFEEVLADAIEKAPKQQFLQFAADESSYFPLTPLRVEASHEPPMIVVPGAGGSVTSFMNLVQSLSRQVTVHGLQPRGLNGTSVPHRTVEAAAALYLRAIRLMQPHGPYRLAGHSFGGWIAFELACRLSAEGEIVEPIVLIDSDAPTAATAEPRQQGRVETLMRLIGLIEEWTERGMNLVRDELVVLDYEAQLSRLLLGMKAIGVLPWNSDVNDIRGLVRVFEVNINTSYVPASRFPGWALLFQPSESSSGVPAEHQRQSEETSEAWRAHVGHLECISVPGKHMTMLRMPGVEVLSGHLQRLWRASPENSSIRTPPTQSEAAAP